MDRIRLGVNIDHVATLRNARGEGFPSVIEAAKIAETAGADMIVCHLREDRRHINDDDVLTLRKYLKRELDLEMALREDVIALSFDVRPDKVTIVPERREEITTEGGIDVAANSDIIRDLAGRYAAKGIEVFLFVEPELEIMELSRDLGVTGVELHTGKYSLSRGDETDFQFKRVLYASKKASELGLKVAAGHGLDYHNVSRIASIEAIYELNIGFSILSYALFNGLATAVKDMRSEIARGRIQKS